ncbi:hypothetical protein Dsin_005324 [Dipteronia sinensis]|uniref:Uncharacterized protein n=1 Tax=Dipteronia sinensis TaxID=43782 RepID=A0AAE0AXL4_9ROSI|nr:hypothetical protein Dsin_005324 [Dipteronia sinensis]
MRGSKMIEALSEEETSGTRDIDVELSKVPQWKPIGVNEGEEHNKRKRRLSTKYNGQQRVRASVDTPDHTDNVVPDIQASTCGYGSFPLDSDQLVHTCDHGAAPSPDDARQDELSQAQGSNCGRHSVRHTTEKVPREVLGPKELETMLNALNSIPERVRNIINEEMGFIPKGNVWYPHSGDHSERGEGMKHEEEGFHGDQVTNDDGGGYDMGDDAQT